MVYPSPSGSPTLGSHFKCVLAFVISGLRFFGSARGKGLKYDFSFWIGFRHNVFGKLKNSVFSRISNIDRSNMISVHKFHKSINLVVNEAKRTRLTAITIYSQIFSVQGLNNEIRNYTSIVFKHPWSICVENSRNPDIDTILAVVFKH